MKPEILYISDTFKQANEFLRDLECDLLELDVLIFDFCRQRLVLETEHFKLRCISMNQHDLGAIRTDDIQYYANCSMLYEKEVHKKIGYRLRPGIKQIKNRKEIIKLMAGMKFDNEEFQSALRYYKIWVDCDNRYGMTDDLANHRRIAYECIKECFERRKRDGEMP